MKKRFLGLLAMACVLISGLALGSCGGEEKKGSNTTPDTEKEEVLQDGISFKTLSVDGKNVYGKVSNATTEFSFIDEVKVEGEATYLVDNDKDCSTPIVSKTVDLEIGDNKFYVLEMIGNDVKLFTVTIRRRPMYEVVFETNGGTLIEKQVVEEDGFATEPTNVVRLGYDFFGWRYDFSKPLTQSVSLTADWKVKEEMEVFNFTSTATVCEITGLKDTTTRGIVIPDYITSIDERAFSGCDSLTSVYITDIEGWCNISFGDFYANPLFYAENLYLNNKPLTELVIPNTITEIKDYAFYSCDSVINVTIPDSVTSIGAYAFGRCDSLTSVVIGDSVTSIGNGAFRYCRGLISVVIGEKVVTIGDEAFFPCAKLAEVINKSLYIEVTKGDSSNGYVGCYALVVYNSDSGVSESQLLNDNGYLVYMNGEEKILVGYRGNETDLVLPSYITRLNDYAFWYCDNLTSVVIPDSVKVMGNSAFYSCSNLREVIIPNSITAIVQNTFYACDNLKVVYYKGSAEEWSSIYGASSNDALKKAVKYYYSEIEPTLDGNYWRYVDGVPTVWTKE